MQEDELHLGKLQEELIRTETELLELKTKMRRKNNGLRDDSKQDKHSSAPPCYDGANGNSDEFSTDNNGSDEVFTEEVDLDRQRNYNVS